MVIESDKSVENTMIQKGILIIIGIIVGVLITIIIQKVVPSSLASNINIVIGEVEAPAICAVFSEKKADEIVTNEGTIEYTYKLESLSKENVNEYVEFLKREGFVIRSKEDISGTKNYNITLCKEYKKGKMVNVEILLSDTDVKIKYSSFDGSLLVEKERVAYVIDNSLKYYEVKTESGVLKVPSFENIAKLTLKEEKKYSYTNNWRYTYEYAKDITSAQKTGYKKDYISLLEKNGYKKIEDLGMEKYSNGSIQISIYNDFNFAIGIAVRS